MDSSRLFPLAGGPDKEAFDEWVPQTNRRLVCLGDHPRVPAYFGGSNC
jgi:hypothetical protein